MTIFQIFVADFFEGRDVDYSTMLRGSIHAIDVTDVTYIGSIPSPGSLNTQCDRTDNSESILIQWIQFTIV